MVSSQAMEHVASRKAQSEQIQTLEGFMKQHAVSRAIVLQVRRQVKARLGESKQIWLESDVHALVLISTALREQLVRRTRMPYVMTHSLFRTWADIESAAIEELCADAVKLQACFAHDVVFKARDLSHDTYFVTAGSLKYSQDAETS